MANEHHARAGSSICGVLDAGNSEHRESMIQPQNANFAAESAPELHEVQKTEPVVPQTPKERVLVFKQDIVRSSTQVGLIGRVKEIGREPKPEEISTDIDHDYLLIGQVRVKWIALNETQANIDDIVVVDRPFVHGDVVSSVSDPSGETGTVVNVDIKVDVRSVDGESRRNVSSKELVRLRRFNSGDFVLFDSWVGRVKDVSDDVTVVFDDGSVCEVTNPDPVHLSTASDFLENGRVPFHPGQRLKDSYSSPAFRRARWISGYWDPSRVEGTVIRVEAETVFVRWYESSATGFAPTPIQTPDPRDLTLLSCLAYENWRVGDWCFLPSSQQVATDLSRPMVSPANGREDGDSFRSSESRSKYRFDRYILSDSVEHTSDDGSCSEIFALDSSFDSAGSVTLPWVCLWDVIKELRDRMEYEDGWCRSATDYDKLEINNNNNNNNNNEFFEFGSCFSSIPVTKLEPAAAADEWSPSSSHRRKLRKVNGKIKDPKTKMVKDEAFEKAFLIVNTSTKVDVIWQSGVRQNEIRSTDLIPIRNDPSAGNEFYPEQYVFSEEISESVKRVGIVKSFDAKERFARVRWLKHAVSAVTEETREFDEEEMVSMYEIRHHLDYGHRYGDVVTRYAGHNIDEQTHPSRTDQPVQQLQSYLSKLGNITGLRDGGIQVTWADGIVSTVGQQTVFSVGRNEYEDSSEDEDDEEDDPTSLWTVDSPDYMYNTLENVVQEKKSDELKHDDDLKATEDSENVTESPDAEDGQDQKIEDSSSFKQFDISTTTPEDQDSCILS